MLVRQYLTFLLLVGMLSLPTVVGAEEATPVASPPATPATPPGEEPPPSGRLDLAAMALNGNDVPPEFGLVYELYLSGDQVAEALADETMTAEEVLATGLRWYYESVYATPENAVRIRSYLEEYDAEAGAIAGFHLLEDETRLTTVDAAFIDHPGPDIGEEPSEMTTGTYPAPDGSGRLSTIDITFRVGRLLGGVSIDTVEGVRPDRDLAIALAQRLEERIRAVLDGDPLPGIDLTLPERLVPLDPAWDSVQEGYVSAADALGPDAASMVLTEYESGYLRTVALGFERDPTLPLPLVTIVVAAFTSESGPLTILSNADTLQPAYVGLERVKIDRIPGAAAAVAYRFANPFVLDAPVDSFRILMVVDAFLVTIDIQGNVTGEGAQDAALALAQVQAACLAAAGPCPVPVMPEGLLAPPVGTPGPTPVG